MSRHLASQHNDVTASSSDAVLLAMRELAQELAELHRAGRVHRALSTSTVALDIAIPRAWLIESVGSEAVPFGGLVPDPEQCPPEFRRPTACNIPPEIDEARRVLNELGIWVSPERIDLYQFGALLCRFITGSPVRAYLSSPRLLFHMPAAARRIIDACLGYEESNRIESASQLVALLDESMGHPEQAGDPANVPPLDALSDTLIVAHSDTSIGARRPPFERLGQFEIQQEIGHGGMGTVYRAYDRSLDRLVAVKVLSQRLASDHGFVKRFQAEAAAAARLTHPNVVPIYFIGDDQGRYFYAMRFIDGESLADRLHREPSLSVAEMLVIVQQVLLGLAAAHRMGLVHRDIKPGNILIDREHGLTMLTDFGLACSTRGPNDSSERNVVVGTLEYMSPEQVRGEPADPRSDLYSVGVLMYLLLAGKAPFEADTLSSHMLHHLYTEPQRLSEVVPTIEPQLEAIVSRLLRKRPEERYPSVEELLLDLDAAMDSLLAHPADGSRSVVSVRNSKSSRIRRVAVDDPSASGPHGPATSLNELHRGGVSTDVHVTGEPHVAAAKSRVPRRSVVAAMAGLAIVMCLLATARFNPQASAVGLQVHQDAVTALAFSPDGRWLISGGGASSSLKASGDTSLRLWDTRTGRLVKQSDRLPVRPRQLVFLGDSRRAVVLASAREDTGTMVVWDSHSGRLGPTNFSEPFALQFDAVRNPTSPTGGSMLAAGRSGLTNVQVEGVVPQPTGSKNPFGSVPVIAVAICEAAAGPRAFAVIDDEPNDSSMIVIVDLKTGSEMSRWPFRHGTITAIAASTDGRTLVTRATETIPRTVDVGRQPPPDATESSLAAFDVVRVWDWTSHTERCHFGPYAPASRCLAVTPDARRALTIAEPSIGPRSHVPQDAVWLDLSTGQEICRVRTNSTTLTAVALCPASFRAALADAEGHVVFCELPQ